MSREERSIFWEVTVSAILSKKVYMYMCPIPNGFRDRAISLYSYKIVDKKEILRTPERKVPCKGPTWTAHVREQYAEEYV
jgi:hypothetical protein